MFVPQETNAELCLHGFSCSEKNTWTVKGGELGRDNS